MLEMTALYSEISIRAATAIQISAASMILLSKGCWDRAAEIATAVEHLELSGHTDFFDKFIKKMNFPTENLW